MQVLESKEDLRSVEARLFLAKIAFSGDELEQVTAIDEVDDQVQVRLSLESAVQIEQEWMAHGQEDLPLFDCTLDEPLRHDVRLANAFHREEAVAAIVIFSLDE